MRRDLRIPTDIRVAARPPLKQEFLALAIGSLLGTGLGVAGWYGGIYETPGKSYPGIWSAVATGAVLGLSMAAGYSRSRQRANEQALLIERARGEIAEADAQVVEEGGFASIWRASQKRLDHYHQLALDQSKRSFLYGILSATAGLAAAIACAVVAAGSNSAAGAAAAGGLGALTTALSGYIGGTFMRAYLLASRQLKAYFEQAAESWRYLSAERLIEQIEDPVRRDATVSELALRVAAQPTLNTVSREPEQST